MKDEEVNKLLVMLVQQGNLEIKYISKLIMLSRWISYCMCFLGGAEISHVATDKDYPIWLKAAMITMCMVSVVIVSGSSALFVSFFNKNISSVLTARQQMLNMKDNPTL